MRLPSRAKEYTVIRNPNPQEMYDLLVQGAVIDGPGSDTVDTYFWADTTNFIYGIDPQIPLKQIRCFFFPRTKEGFVAMLAYACFHGHGWSPKL